jgi:hypothetical protein
MQWQTVAAGKAEDKIAFSFTGHSYLRPRFADWGSLVRSFLIRSSNADAGSYSRPSRWASSASVGTSAPRKALARMDWVSLYISGWQRKLACECRPPAETAYLLDAQSRLALLREPEVYEESVIQKAEPLTVRYQSQQTTPVGRQDQKPSV